MKRKSPYRHPVKGHRRSGVKVHRYERGKGSRPVQTPKVHAPSRGGDFTILVYFDRGQEAHDVIANTYATALNIGLGMIQTPEIPERIRIKRG